MKFNRCIIVIVAAFLIAASGLGTADILPKPVPENQVFFVSSIIEAVGPVTESTSLVWQIGDAGLTELPPAMGTTVWPDTALGSIRSGSIGYVTYSDTIMTNGGQISEVKSFSMDTHAKTVGLYNIETAKVLTYTSQNGSHLMGEESYVLDVAGNWSAGLDNIVCIFAQRSKNAIPAFCNKVTASSKLTSVTTAQIETVGSLTAIGKNANVPAALNYEISITPDANSASGYADGIFSTTFTISVMEGRSDGTLYYIEPWNNWQKWDATNWFPLPNRHPVYHDDPFELIDYDQLASTLTYIDSASVAGGVSTFNKAFSYTSGIWCENCAL